MRISRLHQASAVDVNHRKKQAFSELYHDFEGRVIALFDVDGRVDCRSEGIPVSRYTRLKRAQHHGAARVVARQKKAGRTKCRAYRTQAYPCAAPDERRRDKLGPSFTEVVDVGLEARAIASAACFGRECEDTGNAGPLSSASITRFGRRS